MNRDIVTGMCTRIKGSMRLNHRLLWDTNHLKTMLHERALSEGTIFACFLTIMAFDWLQFTVIRTSPVPHISTWALMDAWVTFSLTIAGIAYLFACNGGAHGQDFLYRYFPLSVAVGWKFVVTMFLASWTVETAAAGASDELRGWASTVVLAVLNVLMILRMGHHLRTIACATHDTTVGKEKWARKFEQ